MRRPSIQVGDQPDHLPSVRRIWAPSVSRRGTVNISAIVMSAVSSVSTFGVLVTVIPCLAAAATSMWSTPLLKLAMSLSWGPACAISGGVYAVGDGRHQHLGLLHRGNQFRLRHRPIVHHETCIEKLAHPRFHLIGQLARDDDKGLLPAGHCFLESVPR